MAALDSATAGATHDVTDMAVHAERFAHFGEVGREVGAEKKKGDPRRAAHGLANTLRGLKNGFVFVRAGHFAADRLKGCHPGIIANARSAEKE
jgi:hypothetical protein